MFQNQIEICCNNSQALTMNEDKRIDEVFNLINQVRSNPAEFVHTYTPLFKQYNNKIFKDRIKTREGAEALNDLITDLKNRRPTYKKLQWCFGLHMIADQQARRLSCFDLLTTEGHQSHQPLPQRAKEFTIVKGKISQVTEFGGQTGEQIVQWLLIDDGLASRKRRSTLLDPVFQYIGIGSCIHGTQGVVTVIVLAEEVTSLVAPGKDGYFFKRQPLRPDQIQKIICQTYRQNEKDRIQKSEVSKNVSSIMGSLFRRDESKKTQPQFYG